MNTVPRAMHIRYGPMTRCPVASAQGFYSSVIDPPEETHRLNKSPRRKPGDSGKAAAVSSLAGERRRVFEHEEVAVVGGHDHDRLVPGVVPLDPLHHRLKRRVAAFHRADGGIDVVGM